MLVWEPPSYGRHRCTRSFDTPKDPLHRCYMLPSAIKGEQPKTDRLPGLRGLLLGTWDRESRIFQNEPRLMTSGS